MGGDADAAVSVIRVHGAENEEIDMADNAEKCAHAPCTCAPRPGSTFCSDYCEHAATSGPPRVESVCECGHPGCTGGH